MLEVLIGFTIFGLIFSLKHFPKVWKLLKRLGRTPKKPNFKITIEKVFDGFIGNEGTIEQLKRLLQYANLKGQNRLPNIGFFGPKSTGKTELAHRISKALGVPTLTLSKSTLNSEESFFKEVSKEISEFSGDTGIAPPMVIFIDEVHVLPRRIQDSLLTALERDDRCFRSKLGDINTHNVTFIVATTDPGKLAEPFISRLSVFWLEPYNVNEIVQILQWRRKNDNAIDPITMFIPDDGLVLIAKAARGVPRKAIELMQQVGVAISLQIIQPTAEEIKEDLRRTLNCDEFGLVEMDKKYLKTVRDFGIAGLGLLCSALGQSKENIEQHIEPWLIQTGFIERTAKGRKLTPKGSLWTEGNLI